jgi:ureidoglycolate hydrolase
MVKKLTPKNFKSFGRIIEHPHKHLKDKRKNIFHIVLRENNNVGWRIAYLIVRDRAINKLEQHPGTFESFEPVEGKVLLYLAKRKDLKKISCFCLDRPVILNKGIWHGVVTLDGESEIKITENAKVKSIYWPLKFSLNSNHKHRP